MMITPAQSQTQEKTAAAIGEVYEVFARSRFLCLAKGYPMPTWEELKPGLTNVVERPKRDYGPFYMLGAEKGIAQANEN